MLVETVILLLCVVGLLPALLATETQEDGELMQTLRQNVHAVLQIYPHTLTHLSLPPTTTE